MRADRADGVYLKNFSVQNSDFNNIYFLETNGFRDRHDRVRVQPGIRGPLVHLRPWIYEDCDTSYNGDSGVYPGSGPNARHGQPDAHGHVYGIEIRKCNSHHNTIGESGTAGNGTWAHDNRYHDNATGITTDSFAGPPACPRTTRSGRTT